MSGFQATGSSLSPAFCPSFDVAGHDADHFDSLRADDGTATTTRPVHLQCLQQHGHRPARTASPSPSSIRSSSGSPGNWGTINVGVSNNSTSVLGDQIRYGITPAQLATFSNSTIQLDPSQNPPSITFSGDPGISAGIKDDLTAIIGQPRFVPIYDQNGGNGNNAWYRVIAFQPARILSVNFQGNPKYVIIQPCLMNDPTAIRGTAQSWTAGGQIDVYLSR